MKFHLLHIVLWGCLFLQFWSCDNSDSEEITREEKIVAEPVKTITMDLDESPPNMDSIRDLFSEYQLPCEWDTYLTELGMVNIQEIDSSIRVELKYSTTDNFMEADLYGCLEKGYLQPDVAERLALCQEELQSLDSNLSLLLYDGLRPRLVQQHMWDLLDMPINEKTKFVSNPKKGSLHNFGAAVDITLFDLTTQTALDMGTPYDYIGVLAWPTKEKKMLKDSLLTQRQVDNRILLRRVLKKGRFFNIQTEWWHFNACYRDKARELYQLIEGDSSLIDFPM